MIGLLIGAALAGPWTRHEGSYYARTGVDAYVPRVYVDPLTGNPVDTERRYLGVQAGAYGEVGLPTKWPVQATVSAPFTRGSLTFETPQGMGRATTYRLGDARLAVQTALHRTWPLALSVGAKVPLYRNDAVGRHQGVYQEQFPKPGDGQVDLSTMLLAGGGKGQAWGEVGVGWVHRTEWFYDWNTTLRFVDGVDFYGTTGIHKGDAFWMLKTEGRYNPVDNGVTRAWVSVGPAVLWDVSEDFSLEAAVRYEPTSAHAARGVGFGVGISRRND